MESANTDEWTDANFHIAKRTKCSCDSNGFVFCKWEWEEISNIRHCTLSCIRSRRYCWSLFGIIYVFTFNTAPFNRWTVELSSIFGFTTESNKKMQSLQVNGGEFMNKMNEKWMTHVHFFVTVWLDLSTVSVRLVLRHRLRPFTLVPA